MVSDLLTARLPGTPRAALDSPVDILLTAFLVALLVVRVVHRAAAPPGSPWRLHPVDIAAGPLLVGFVVIAIGRILEIAPLG